MQIIVTKIVEHRPDLYFDAFTYGVDEFLSVERVLHEAKIGPAFSNLRRANDKRIGRRYQISSFGKSSLERLLGGEFIETKQGISLRLDGNESSGYACREISVSGLGRSCRDLAAPSDDVALVKCAIIAGELSWFGGVAEKGSCRRI